MENKLLYELEYQVGELRKQYINHIDTDDITLKEVLDLGFNNVYINDIGIYKDNENNYVANGYFIENKELLNAKIKYIEDETKEDWYGNYLEVYCEFVDSKYNDILKGVVKK